MFRIEDRDLFEDTVEQAITDALRNSPTRRKADRWVKYIGQAAQYLRRPELSGLEYDRGTHTLHFTASTDEIFTVTTGTCDCEAFARAKAPCEHRAAARLLRRYLDRYESGEVIAPVPLTRLFHTDDEFLQCGSEDCRWIGRQAQLGYNRINYLPTCPKCDSENLGPAVVQVRGTRGSFIAAIKSAFPTAFGHRAGGAV